MRKILTSSLVFLVSISNVVPYLPQMVKDVYAVGIDEGENKKNAEIVQNSEDDKLAEFVDFNHEIEETKEQPSVQVEESELHPLKEDDQETSTLEGKPETAPIGNEVEASESTSTSEVEKNTGNGLIRDLLPDPVVKEVFPDPNLAQAIAELFNRTVNDQISIVHELNVFTTDTQLLSLNNRGIKKLDGMEHFISATMIAFHNNEITSLEPLRNLPRLEGLYANGNYIEDLEPVWEMGLPVILVANNRITKLPASPPVLSWVDISNNQISDIRMLLQVDPSRLNASNQQITLPQADIAESTFFELYSVNDTSVEIDWLNAGSLIEDQLSWGYSGLNQMTFTSNEIDFSGTVSQEITGSNPLINELFPDPNLAQAVAELFNRTVNDEISIVQELNTHVNTLDFSGRQISQLDGIEYFSSVMNLRLGNNQISDISIPTGKMPQLRTLYIDSNEIIELPNEINLPVLIGLYLGDNKIENIKPLALGNLSRLASLSLSINKIEDISPLSKLPSITSLWLASNGLEDISVLSELPQLSSLQISNNNIIDLSPLSNLTRLVILSLNDNQISDISALNNLSSLTTLRLDRNKIKDLSSLSELPRLTRVEIDNNQIVDLSPLSKLSAVIVARNQAITLDPVVLGTENPLQLATLDGLTMQTEFRTDGSFIENELVWVNSGSNSFTFDGSGVNESGQSITFSGTVTQEVILDFGLTAVPERFEFGGDNRVSPNLSQIQAENSDVVTVEDNRADQVGWRLQVRMAELTSETNNRLTGTTMSIKTAFTESGGGEVPHLFDTLTINTSNRQLVSANPGEGTGKWSIGFNELSLNIPGSVARAGESYTGNVTWTLLDTP